MFKRYKFDAVRSTISFLCLLFIANWLNPGLAVAQPYPNKPITVVVPYPPGSTTDSLMRMLGPKLAEKLGQTVIIDNRSGASTSIGTSHVAKAAPDGYTVLIQAPNLVTNEYMFDNLDWKYGDFKPVTLLVKWSNLLVAGPDASVKDFRAMVASGEKDSSSFTYGTPGIGSLSHLAIEMLNRHAGIAMAHITYNGPAPMMTDLIGGHIKYGVTNPANLMPLVQDKKSRVTPLVVLSSQRDKTIPDVPSLADFGIDGIDSNGWLGIVVPERTSDEIVARLNAAFVETLNEEDIQKQVRKIYLEPIGSTPESFAEYLDSESRKWGAAIKAVRIR
jgi:tripartite-type tricarboxylate transporter receptor subunit TctC